MTVAGYQIVNSLTPAKMVPKPCRSTGFGLRLALVGAVAMCLSVGSGNGAWAGGFSNPDFGIRRMGMLAVTARPDDGTALFHNPAGMTLLDGTNIYHHQSWFAVETGMRMYDSEGFLLPEDHDIEPDWNIGAIPFIGVSSDLGFERLRLGFGIYAPNAYGAALPDDEATRYHIIRAAFIASRATLAAAYEFSDRFSLGGGLSLIHVYFTAKKVMNPLVLGDPDVRFLPVEETAPLDAELNLDGMAFTAGWNLGLLFTPTDTLRLGLVFESGAPIDLEGDVKLTYAGGSSDSTRHHTEMVIPLTLRAGINWEFAPDFELGADIFWWHYQVLQEQRTMLDNPLMGSEEIVDPKNYGNSWNWCVGLLYRVIPEVELMVGYQWDYTPIPSRTLTLDNPSRTQTGVSLGSRWQVTGHLRLGLAYVHNWYELLDIQDSVSTPPTNLKGWGASNEFGFDLLWTL